MLVVMICCRATLACKTKYWTVFLWDVASIPLPLILVNVAHASLGMAAKGKPNPAFDDFIAGMFHAFIAYALCFILVLPEDDLQRTTSYSLIAARAFVFFTPVLLVPTYLCRSMAPETYYPVLGLTYVLYVSLTIAIMTGIVVRGRGS